MVTSASRLSGERMGSLSYSRSSGSDPRAPHRRRRHLRSRLRPLRCSTPRAETRGSGPSAALSYALASLSKVSTPKTPPRSRGRHPGRPHFLLGLHQLQRMLLRDLQRRGHMRLRNGVGERRELLRARKRFELLDHVLRGRQDVVGAGNHRFVVQLDGGRRRRRRVRIAGRVVLYDRSGVPGRLL
jgi:hypothetical protein